MWSRRLVHERAGVPPYDDDTEIPIYVQCRDAANGGLSPDDDINFAIAVTLEVEADVQYDIHEEVEERIKLRLQQGG